MLWRTAALCRSRRSLYHQAIWLTQINRDDIPVQNRLFRLLFGEVMERSADVAFRQPDHDAVGQVEVPAAASDPGSGVDHLVQGRHGSQVAEQFLRVLGGIGADDLSRLL